MPFYEYECRSCRFYVEVLQKISDKPLKKCPSCGKAGFKRLMSAPVFRLKGSGWYETDFKSDQEGQRNLAGADREEAKAAAAETKPAGDDQGAAKPAAEAPAAKPEQPKSADAAPKARREGKAVKKASKPAAKASSRRAARRPAKAARRGGRR